MAPLPPSHYNEQAPQILPRRRRPCHPRSAVSRRRRHRATSDPKPPRPHSPTLPLPLPAIPPLLRLLLLAPPPLLPILPPFPLPLHHLLPHRLLRLTLSDRLLHLRSHRGPLAPRPPASPLRPLVRHPSFLSRSLSIQSLSVSGRLVLLAATSDVDGHLLPALPLPLVFDPLSAAWSHGPALPAPRRWCAAGTLSGFVFVASGIGSHFTNDVARSFEKWRFAGAGEGWERLGRMKDGRFSREAIDAVGCRGKLWMVNVKGSAAMGEEEIYVVDEDKGALSRWDWEGGEWVGVVESPMLVGAQQIAAVGGKVCAVVEGVKGVVVVDVKAVPARVWVVEMPTGYEVIAVHVFPRMCCRRRKRPR